MALFFTCNLCRLRESLPESNKAGERDTHQNFNPFHQLRPGDEYSQRRGLATM